MERMNGSNSESWIQDLSLAQAETLGEKSNFEIVKIFTDDKHLKLVKVIKEELPSYLKRHKAKT